MNLDIFFENFELLADAPNGVQKLRELILQLAVMGKLVPQDPSDEPASVLLERIKNEKKKLSEEGNLKNDSLPLIENGELPFEIPQSWKWIRLGEVINYNGAQKVSSEDIPDDAWVLDLEDIEKNTSKILNHVYFKDRKSKSTKAKFNKGNVLYGKLRPYLNKVVVAEDNGYCTTEIVPLSIYTGIDPYYLMYSLKRPDFLEYVNSKTYGTKMPRLGTEDARKSLFPLPPLAEQKRIVSKVDELMALCDKLEVRCQKKQEIHSKLNSAALDRMLSAENQDEFEQHWQHICENFDLLYDNPENVEKLRQAILQLAVQGKLVPHNSEDESASVLIDKIEADIKKTVNKGNLKKLTSIDSDNVFFKLPNSWEWIQLGKLLTFGPKNGYSPKPVDFVTNTKSLTLSATTSGKFRDDCFKYIDEKIDKDSHLWLEENDILIQRGNSIEYVGIAAVYKGPSHNFIYPDLMMKLRVHQSVNTDFLHIALNNRFSRDYFAEKASGTSGSMPKINQNTVINLPIPLPPLVEQKRIVEKVEQLMGLCDELQTKLRKEQEDSEKLMEAIVKGLLEGENTEKTELEKTIPLQVATIKLK